jgi:hypothetical protein
VQVEQLVIPPGAAVAGIVDGRVGMGFSGGCAFGPLLLGATLTIETGFVGERIGPYSPPTTVEEPDNAVLDEVPADDTVTVADGG